MNGKKGDWGPAEKDFAGPFLPRMTLGPFFRVYLKRRSE